MSTPSPRFVLGLDPGTTAFGCCLLAFAPDVKPTVTGYAVLMPRGIGRSERLGDLMAQLDALVEGLPENATMAIEGGFVGKGAQSSLAIAEARGIAVAVCARRGVVVDVVSPSAGKIAACGHGHAPKEDVQEAIANLCTLPIAIPVMPQDASDAAAVALASMITAGKWRRPDRLEVNRKRRTKRATSVAQFLTLATRRIGG